MSAEDPLIESVISTLLENTKCYWWVEIREDIIRNLDNLMELFKEGLISKERITGILISVKNSRAYKESSGSDLHRKIDDVTMFVLKKKV